MLNKKLIYETIQDCKANINMLESLMGECPSAYLENCTNDAQKPLPDEGDQTMAKHRMRICIGSNDDGSPVIMQVSGNTQFELADNIVRAMLNSPRRFEFIPNDVTIRAPEACNTPTFQTYTEEWQHTYKDDKQRENTKAGYKSYLTRHIFPTWGNTPINQITTKDIQDFLNSRKHLSSKTLREMLCLLKQIFDSAVEDGLIAVNPAKSTRLTNPGKPSVKRNALDEDALKGIVANLDSLNEQDRRFMALAIYTGMRKGELIGLRWEDIDIASNVIHVRRSANVNKGRAIIGDPKTESGKRDVPIAPELLKYLIPLKQTGFIIVGTRDSSGKEPISGTTYNLMLQRINKSINLHDATAHVFRHTMGTMLYDAEQNVKTVQAIMGHSDFKTTADRYVHAVDSRKQEAMNKVSDVLALNPQT